MPRRNVAEGLLACALEMLAEARHELQIAYEHAELAGLEWVDTARQAVATTDLLLDALGAETAPVALLAVAG